MRVVVDRDQYKLSVDDTKNRLFLEVWGNLDDPKRFDNYLDDWEKALSHASPGFTLLADYTQTGVFFLPHIWKKAQLKIFQAGVSKVAVVWGKRILGKITTEQAAAEASTEYAERRRSFETLAEAEGWLDE